MSRVVSQGLSEEVGEESMSFRGGSGVYRAVIP